VCRIGFSWPTARTFRAERIRSTTASGTAPSHGWRSITEIVDPGPADASVSERRAAADIRHRRDDELLPGRRLGVAQMRQALDRRRQRFPDRRRLVGGVPQFQLVEEAQDARSALERLIELEVELRDALQPQPLAELVTDERHRPTERP